MPKMYRIIHVKSDLSAQIGRYVFQVPICDVNPAPQINSGFCGDSYDALESAVINSSTHIKDFSHDIFFLTAGVAQDVAFTGILRYFKRLDISTVSVGDRFYIDRWDASHPYILVNGVSYTPSTHTGALNLSYYCADGTLAYNNVSYNCGWTDHGSWTSTTTGLLPWIWCNPNTVNLDLTRTIFSYDTRSGRGASFQTYATGFAPTSLANAQKFWSVVKQADDIDVTEPIGNTTGDYEFTGDDIDLPDAPDETITGVLVSGFLNIYSPSAQNLKDFGQALWTNAFNVKWYDLDSVSNLILNTISDPINFIIGLFMLPVTPATGGNSGIFLGGINVNTVSAPKVTKQFVTVDFGEINISELYGSYLDYSYSRVSIYLPYVGVADIDVQEVTGGSVTLQYIIDCFTGACVANVKCTKVTATPWGESYVNKTVHSYSGNVALQLPISAGSFDTMTQGLINVGLGLISSPAVAVAKGAGDVIQNVGGDATTRGSLSSNTGRLCYQTPYLMFTKPIETRPASLASVHGYSAGWGGKLSSMSGYVECSDVKLDGVTATDKELNMIKTLLETGVFV